jgi:N-acetylglucosaminyl-diphospho-decaprenol L-rhamnosyltransferase
MAVELTYCVVNTEHRQLLSYCLDAIARERATVDFETEALVLDNASRDGSAETARTHAVTSEVIALDRRRGRGENFSALLQRAHGRYCLLLDEDSELEPGATAALHAALDRTRNAGAAGATLVTPDGVQQPSAWRFPSPWTRLLSVLGLRRRFVVQSRGDRVRPVDWAPAAALLVCRDAAEEVGWFDGDEVDFCRRLRTARRQVLHVPEARAVHHRRA